MNYLFSLLLVLSLSVSPALRAADQPAARSFIETLVYYSEKMTRPLVTPLAHFFSKAVESASALQANNGNVMRAEQHLKKQVYELESFANNLITARKDFAKQYALNLSAEQWLRYSQEIIKQKQEHTQNTPIGVVDVEKVITNIRERIIASSNNTGVTSAQKIQAQEYMKDLQKLHLADVNQLHNNWRVQEGRYQELQKLLGAAPSTWYKTVARVVGYGAVFVGGPYLGNMLYKKYMDPYFATTSNGYDAQEIYQQITQIEKECNALEKEKADPKTSQKRKNEVAALIAQLKNSLKALKDQINNLGNNPPQKPSNFRYYAGVAARVCTMAALTYIFYKIFKKVDEKYLVSNFVHTPLAPEQRILFTQELAQLEQTKNAWDKQVLISKQINAINDALDISDDSQLVGGILTMQSLFENLPAYGESLKDTAQQVEELRVDLIAKMLSLSGLG